MAVDLVEGTMVRIAKNSVLFPNRIGFVHAVKNGTLYLRTSMEPDMYGVTAMFMVPLSRL